jgi:hypothetical protein
MAINSSPSRRAKVIVTKDKTPVITDPVRAARGIVSPKNLGALPHSCSRTGLQRNSTHDCE